MYFQKPPLIAHAGAVKPVVNCLNSGLSLDLHPYFVNADCKGSDESSYLHRLVLAVMFCDKYQNLMSRIYDV